ncbi:class I SAM-dependent methyltransferase [Gilvimarinus algae]|uniref:Class I SAM-dependent methyltransferase n=1 Tax=Gilvimarinus algae TaxID=3058037 RepID=A0ABT8TGN7_9GAMM|nr:class I SAM-dependent methyltransferase [Gilvimarinus sp. SDUM040014]MDO3383255.1 class I SAM-dependent methyltransferase [Gilvimarinus sp. SDUM040014]
MSTSANQISLNLLNCLDSEDERKLLARFLTCECVLPDRPGVLGIASERAPSKGSILEFGVYKGASIRYLSDLFPGRRIYGFDSFVGLPEPWVRTTDGKFYGVGHFRLTQKPTVPDNVTLVEGYFESTLPVWLSSFNGIVALLHIDADLYSSAKFVLESLDRYLVPEVVIVFDELCDWQNSGVYSAWPDGEWKAFCAWINASKFNFEVIARGVQYSAAIRITA